MQIREIKHQTLRKFFLSCYLWLLIIVMVCCCVPQHSKAHTGLYAGASVGKVKNFTALYDKTLLNQKFEFESNNAYGGGIGYSLTRFFRAEVYYNFINKLTYSYQDTAPLANTSTASFQHDLSIHNVMLNGYISLPIISYVYPFCKLGMGYAYFPQNTLKEITATDGAITNVAESVHSTYSLALGVTFDIVPYIIVSMMYEWQGYGENSTLFSGNNTITGSTLIDKIQKNLEKYKLRSSAFTTQILLTF